MASGQSFLPPPNSFPSFSPTLLSIQLEWGRGFPGKTAKGECHHFACNKTKGESQIHLPLSCQNRSGQAYMSPPWSANSPCWVQTGLVQNTFLPASSLASFLEAQKYIRLGVVAARDELLVYLPGCSWRERLESVAPLSLWVWMDGSEYCYWECGGVVFLGKGLWPASSPSLGIYNRAAIAD